MKAKSKTNKQKNSIEASPIIFTFTWVRKCMLFNKNNKVSEYR